MRGIIVREDGGTLVVEPSDAEVSRFGLGRTVEVRDMQAVLPRASIASLLNADLFDCNGHRVLTVRSAEWTAHYGRLTEVTVRGFAGDV